MVHASLFLNKTGYVPGEPIDYTIEVNNMSDKDVIGLEFDLKQVSGAGSSEVIVEEA